MGSPTGGVDSLKTFLATVLPAGAANSDEVAPVIGGTLESDIVTLFRPDRNTAAARRTG